MKGTTMTRTIRFILAAISLLFMACIVAAPMLAHAQQTLPTMCGAEASGKRYLQGDVWAGKSPGQYVDELGYWQYCPAWVNPDGGDPRTPEPQPACPGRYVHTLHDGCHLACACHLACCVSPQKFL